MNWCGKFESRHVHLPFRDFPFVFMLTPFFLQISFLLFGTMDLVLQPFDWLPFGEKGKMSERTLEGGASRVHVTSSDDSCVERNACA